ncbi:MAG: ChaN family lipoprotein [Bacteroidetes bacterium]|nr:ChaN family lipoprotein [Bacteroidota bacterium]MBU1717435.1 ChaN family lipoprotein [Bacteroidota bacterium]
MNKLILLLLPLAFAFASNKEAFIIKTKDGKTIEYSEMYAQLAKADVIFFGELHNNPIAHWLEYEVARDLYEDKKEALVLGAEMFEADNQIILDEYLSGLIKENVFKEDCKLWPNYQTDYRPLVEYARENKIRFVATNIPRRYASMINSGGLKVLDELSQEARQYVAPSPIVYDPDVSCYKNMTQTGMPGKMSAMVHLAEAQASKDATMAHFLYKNFKRGQTFLHFNGSWHSDNHEGIVWYLRKANADLKIVVLTTIEAENYASIKVEDLQQADFTIVVPTTMTKTY